MDGRGLKFENLFEANEFKQTAENSEFSLDIEVHAVSSYKEQW